MPPDYEVLFSIPFSLILAIGLLVGLLAAAVWRFRSHRQKVASQRTPGEHSWLPALLEALPYGAVFTSKQGTPIFANRQALCWLGQTDVSSELPGSVRLLVEKAKSSGERQGPEVQVLPGQEEMLWIETIPLAEADGILVTITENRTKGVTAGIHQRLTRTIAHELRTPLTAIIGHTDILGSCSIEEEDLWQRSRQFIAGEVERLARLVEDLLTFSRLDMAVSASMPVNLRAVAEEAISTSWQSAEEKGITLVLQAPGTLPRVRGDADRLRQVFVNLLDNGIKYTPTGGRVAVRLVQDTDRVGVEVSDTGIGIPGSDLPHIFDPFFRSEHARKSAPGTGLGLTIARTILLHHGAELQAQSELEHGTSFSFSLPAAV
ncbi:MAG: HAMP domain-containing histidine kinase [Anaerolineales bacterium]|nr:HAMP domain-containing histidine kinase [Anaerolineales bacterium]